MEIGTQMIDARKLTVNDVTTIADVASFTSLRPADRVRHVGKL